MKPRSIKLIGIILIFTTIGCETNPKLIEIEPIKHPYKLSEEIITNLESSSEPWKYSRTAKDL